MEISKSTPYVRYRENISSTLHKGTIHIESEYLDRERKTTIESIEGQTWQNMVNGENKEEEILPRLGLKIEGNEDVLDTVEQHMPIDTIIGDIEPVANEDGTYTYEISTMEGSYAKTLDGENNFSLTSDGLDASMYIKYNAQGEEVNGNIVMNSQSDYTIENSNTGEINNAILKGSTKYRDIDTGEFLETFEEGRNLELVSVQMPVLTTTNEDGTKTNILTVNEDVTLRGIGDVQDTLDCLTGEVTERIGEVVLDGSENWRTDGGNELYSRFVYTISGVRTKWYKVLSDKFIGAEINSLDGEKIYRNGYGRINGIIISNNKLENLTVDGLKTYLATNPVTLQYELEESIVKTVDLTIKDQDNKIIQTLHTYPSTTHINLSSDGLIPSAELSYTMYGNIGETTGEKITDGTDSKLIEGKIYGDTLCNVLPSPSLKEDDNGNNVSTYYLDMVKPNTQYTTKSSSDCNATIDGTSYPLSANGTFTTPSTITNKTMVLDAPVNDLMFIEGDLTGRELDYFTGMQSVKMPVLTAIGKNLFNGEIEIGEINTSTGLNETSNKCVRSVDYIGYNENTDIVVSINNPSFNDGSAIIIYCYDSNKNLISRENVSNLKITPSGTRYVRFRARKKDNSVVTNEEFSNLKIQLEKATQATDYEPYKTNILTVNEKVELHGIGDVKDELDLVNECVVRRIGETVLDGNETWEMWNEKDNSYGFALRNYNIDFKLATIPLCNCLASASYLDLYNGIIDRGIALLAGNAPGFSIFIRLPKTECIGLEDFKTKLQTNPITVLYQLATPTTEPVRIVPQNRKQSTVSLTLQSPLQKVGNVADQLRWNPYKGHYVRYNYIQDGVANSTYTFEDLKDMNERKFVNLYNQRTYIDTDHTVQVISHGLSRYCLAEQGKQYQVRWDWIEQPSVDTIKVDLCGNVKEIPSSDNSVVIDVEKFTHQFIQIQGLGLSGKITNLMVIETVNGEIPDVDFFSGIQCIGNTVTIDGNTKVQIDMEQTNGNLFDNTIGIYNNGNDIRFMLDMVRPNKTYTLKYDNTSVTKTMKYNQKTFNDDGGNSAIQTSNNGSANIYYPLELCYADMAKDGIRPRYYDKESIILPMKLCRVGNIYDNLYYDDLKGYYRIQQSIGHKYFTGETTEVWTMETTNGYRTIKFTCTSANIDQIALGETICNSFRHLSTINDDIEGFIIYNGNFVIRIDKDRLTDKTVDGFKALLASSPIHLFYQLKTPQMINLTEYPNRIELNTYRDEIFTFFKGMNPTKFTLSVPMDKTYRYEIEEEGQGLANRVTVNNETISAENVVAVKEVRGQGIANIIEDVNNVVITPRPNHGGKATSHTLNNTKPATIRVHGFEPSGDTAIGTYNVTDKAYQLKVMSSNGDNSLSDYYVLNVPYKLETYADGTKDMVYYDEAYKQWHFKGSSVKEYTVASDGTLSEIVEVFRGLSPRSGMIAEFKLMFTSGTTASRMYYSLNGTTYSYTSLRNMSDGNYLYVGIFNTGGTKIDIAYKTDPNAEYTNLSPLSTQVPECFMVNQIQSCTFCEVTLDKQYIYSEMNAPIELDTYDGSTKVFMDGNATDTNIIIRNECATKIVNTYTDTEYTVYWKYVDGLGNLRITLGGTTVEVDGKQEYATIKTQLNAPQELLYMGGYNLSIKDLMVVKGAKIDDLPYFENSREVGTIYTDEQGQPILDENGRKQYLITLIQGGNIIEKQDKDSIIYTNNKKHNTVVTKILGVNPIKID